MITWRTIESKTEDHWLELEGTDGGASIVRQPDGSERENPIYNWRAVCKWDGCVHLDSYSNGYGWDHPCDDECQCCHNYEHICDVDEFIDGLQRLKAKAAAFFRGKSGEEYWPTDAVDAMVQNSPLELPSAR